MTFAKYYFRYIVVVMYRLFCSTIFCLFISTNLLSQEVAISEAINVRNYFSYELIGQIENRILLYRDKGFTKEVDIFNMDMEHTQLSELNFEKRKSDVFNVIGFDSLFQVLYGYMEKDSMVFKLRHYDKLVRLIDSTTLIKVPKRIIKKRITSAISKDKKKILLSTKNSENEFLFYLYDYKRKKIIWNGRILFQKKINEIYLTNTGKIILRESNQSKNNNEIIFHVVTPGENLPLTTKINLGLYFYKDILIDFDDKNEQLIISGNYAEKHDRDVKGIYYIKKKLKNLLNLEVPNLIPYEQRLSAELIQGKRKNRKRILDDLQLKEVLFRNDGGVIFINEITKEYSRRSAYNSAFSNRNSSHSGISRRGWMDFYNEDIIITNVDPQGETEWNKVLYKKQFSQDDDAIFSSFFVMRTPSRLRFIYNDEIKNNSTVSEYLLDPVGQMARNSLMSTEYQNMRLRFKDAIQLSSTSVLIPSERNYDLSLVKITY